MVCLHAVEQLLHCTQQFKMSRSLVLRDSVAQAAGPAMSLRAGRPPAGCDASGPSRRRELRLLDSPAVAVAGGEEAVAAFKFTFDSEPGGPVSLPAAP